MKTPAVLLLTTLTTAAWASPAPLLESDARRAIQALGKQLQAEMKQAMQAGGPLEAINTCNTRALPLTEQISKTQQLEISRTALRYRNPDNAPDAWETQAMQQFIERQQAGESFKGMVFSEIVEERGQKVFRMLQAIPTKNQCLGCHGGTLEPQIEEQINRLYPADQARGFKEGELRGAFSVRRAL